jgi:hypothetical protein
MLSLTAECRVLSLPPIWCKMVRGKVVRSKQPLAICLVGVQEVAGSNPAVPISWPMAKKECIVPLWRAGVVSIQPRTWLSEVADVPESGSIRKSNYQEVYDTPESRRCNDEIVDKPKLDPVELAWGSMPVHRQSAKRDAPSSPADPRDRLHHLNSFCRELQLDAGASFPRFVESAIGPCDGKAHPRPRV